MLLCWLSQGNSWVLLLSPHRRQSVCRKNGVFLEKEFLAKEVSGRTVQLDEVSEPSEPRTETMEVVPPVIPMKEPVAPALDTGTSQKLVTEHGR